jgi:hypothetical protein
VRPRAFPGTENLVLLVFWNLFDLIALFEANSCLNFNLLLNAKFFASDDVDKQGKNEGTQNFGLVLLR